MTLGTLELDFVHMIEIESSWKLLTDTATVKMPANLGVNRLRLTDYLSHGELALISLGYNGANEQVFSGYINRFNGKVPVEIYLEDEAYQLKRKTLNGNFSRLSELTAALDTWVVTYEDIDWGQFIVQNETVGHVLERLRKEYGLYCFFRADALHIGGQYSDGGVTHTFRLDWNTISDELEYRRREDIKLKVKATSHLGGDVKLEVELGDGEGESRTLNFYGLSDSELRKAAERELDRLKYDGWRGTFTCFGEPIVRHGDRVTITHPEQSDRTGTYYVDSVSTSFGVDGYRQKIELGPIAKS